MVRLMIFISIFVSCIVGVNSAKSDEVDAPQNPVNAPSREVLTKSQWQRVDQSIKRGLEFLISQQQTDGSFRTDDIGQPAVTSLCVMGFLANGYLPGEGKYGDELSKAVEFIISNQTQSGVIASAHPAGPKISRVFKNYHVGKTITYNHAISSLLLSEIYGMTGGLNGQIDESVIQRCLDVSLKMQRWPKPKKTGLGGWRYVHKLPVESDLSLTGWQLMFLRSAKNAGFDVPPEPIEAATNYVLRCFRPDYGTFNYVINGKMDRRSRGMAGAGILALAHAGLHHREEAITAGDWILKNGFEEYNNIRKFTMTDWYPDCYHYGVFYCSQGMYQLGGKHWELFFPKTSDVLIENQGGDGAWAACNGDANRYGKTYSSALSILALSAPNQLLPIFHR